MGPAVAVTHGRATGWANGTLVARFDMTPDLAVFRVQTDGPLFHFRPGQYAVLGVPASVPRCSSADSDEEEPSNPDKLIRRAYSIASSSRVNEYVELYITLVRSGALTPRLWMLRPGNRLWLGPKAKGHFTMQEVRPDKNVVLVGTGTGLAPYMSMIRDHHQCNVGRMWVVIHGARYVGELGYRDELEDLDRQYRTLAYMPTVSRPNRDAGWQGHVGRVQSVFADGLLESMLGGTLSPESTHVFLAGNPEMVDDMEQRLLAQRFSVHHARSPGTLHVERYW